MMFCSQNNSKENTLEYRYTGFYARFETPSKELASLMMSADVLVGDPFEIFFKRDEGDERAWLRNRFGAEIGFLDAAATRNVKLELARGHVVNALLALVAYSDTPDPGLYWGEMAIVCYDVALQDCFSPFMAQLKTKLANGVRPNINLRFSDVDRIIENPTWFPSETTPLPEMKPGIAPVKTKLSYTERIVERGRAGSIPLYIVSVAFIVALVGAILWLLASLLGLI